MRGTLLKDLLGDELEKFWSSDNEVGYSQVVVSGSTSRSYTLVCPYCNESYNKLLSSILKTGFACKSCIKAIAKRREESLQGKYPDVARMYDRRENQFPSTDVKPKVSRYCNFRCDNGHDFTSILRSVVNSSEKGNSGCPYCSNVRVSSGENDFQTMYSQESLYWDYDLNTVKPNEVLAGSNRAYWFKCPKGHESFLEELSGFKSKGLFCPICHNRRVLVGYNDFKSRCPNIASYWDYDKNSCGPEEVIYGSASEFWFKCELGHSFQKSLDIIKESEGKSNGCPYCNGRQIREGFNDFASKEPELAEMWDYDKNAVSPEEVFYRSNNYFWFKCSNGHSFKKMPIDLIAAKGRRSKGCPFCASSKLVEVDNTYYLSKVEIESYYKEWVIGHITGNLSADDFLSKHYDRKGSFSCDKGHIFQRSWSDIKRYGVGCPVCSGHVLQRGFNDFASCHPGLLRYWDYERNTVSPKDVLRFSSEVVWWKCTRCDSGRFRQGISTRTATRGLCNSCSESYRRSFAEQELAGFINQYVDVRTNVKLDGVELDILIPSLNIAFEYNGLYYHSEAKGKTKWYHKSKYDICKKHGIVLYCIWEDDYELRKERVLSWVKTKIGVNSQNKVNARQCGLYAEDEIDAREFLDKHHIQGHIKLSRYISLRKPENTDGSLGDIVALMAYIVDNDGFIQIRRYATSEMVRGGFTKILSWLEHNSDCVGAVTFSDNAISDGGLYSSTGFTRYADVDPDYAYVVNNQRVHKFNFRKEDFKKNSSLDYIEGLTEKELADLNGLVRVWDYGKVKWVKYFDN